MTNSPIEKKKKHRARRTVLIILLCFVLILALLVGSFFLLAKIGHDSLTDRDGVIEVPSDLVDHADPDGTHITYQGKHYVLNENAVSVLFLGVDKKDIQQDFGSGKNGQADSLFVGVMDSATGEVKIIPLSREIMTEVKTYSPEGNYVGTEKMQLCLAYAYGNTGEESCQNVADAVRGLLYGMEVDAYVAIDMDGVVALTDAIGGVKLTTLETVKGSRVTVPGDQTMTLTGEYAKTYIRGRSQDLEANNLRLRRQKQFLGAFFEQGKAKIRNDLTSVPSYYNIVKPYVVSDLGLPEVTWLAKTAVTAPGMAMTYLDVKGETKMGEAHTEFYPDPTSLYEAVLNAYYTCED